MISTNKNFRFEKKYLLDRDSAFLLKQRLSYILQPDHSSPGGKYRISSLYFDDQYNTSFYEKQNGVLRRDKFRVRFYNGRMDTIRLECKHKHDEMISKDSALITHEQYQMMLHGTYRFMRNRSASVFEKFYTAHLLKHMRPAIMIDYDRQAFIHQTGNVRITFDSNLSASMPMASHSFSILPYKNVVLEIKYDHFIPSFIGALLTSAPFTQQLPISKFYMGKLVLQGKYYT
jgi:VTC domain.